MIHYTSGEGENSPEIPFRQGWEALGGERLCINIHHNVYLCIATRANYLRRRRKTASGEGGKNTHETTTSYRNSRAAWARHRSPVRTSYGENLRGVVSMLHKQRSLATFMSCRLSKGPDGYSLSQRNGSTKMIPCLEFVKCLRALAWKCGRR